MPPSPRERFLAYVRSQGAMRPIVSPFLPAPEVVSAALDYVGLPSCEEPVRNEVTLSRAMDTYPMFLTDCRVLVFSLATRLGRGTLRKTNAKPECCHRPGLWYNADSEDWVGRGE